MLFQRSTKTAALCMYVHVQYITCRRFLTFITELQAFNKQFRLYYYWSKPQLSPRYICIPTSSSSFVQSTCMYICTVLFARKEGPSLARQMSQLLYGVILDIITKKSHVRTQNDSFPLCWIGFFYMYMYVQKDKRAKQSTFRMWMDMLISPKSSL